MKYYIGVLLFILSIQLSAQNTNVLGHKFNGQQIDLSGQSSIVTINQAPATFAGNGNVIPNDILKHDVYLVLRIEHDKNYLIATPYKLDLEVELSGASDENNNPLAATLANETMSLEVNPYTGVGSFVDQHVIKLSSKYSGLHNVTAKIISATQTIGSTPTPINLLPKEIMFELKSFTKFVYDLNAPGSNAANYLPSFIDHDVDGNGTKDYLEIFANYDGAEYYQIEWTYINDYADLCWDNSDPENASLAMKLFKSPAILNYDFRHNATRISIKNGNHYALPLVFDRGYLLIRTRGVGKDMANPNNETFTPWSIQTDAGLVSSLYSDFIPTSLSPTNYTCTLIASNFANYGDQATYVPNGMVYPLSSSHSENLIWQYSTTFAEEGKYKSVVAYFDASLHNRQSVTRVNSDKNIIVGETIYDNQGRPAVNILPVPVTDLNESSADAGFGPPIKYYPGFNKNSDDRPYNKSNFDYGNDCNIITGPLNTNSGASKYYSPDADPSVNPYTPDAKKFPMTQVEYTPDGTGRISRQSGVGEMYNLNNDKATQYFYGQPDQLLLDRLFGSEVGDASHYKYNVVIDANGQASIAYLDQEGRTIATALLADVKKEGANNQPILEPLLSNPTATTLLTSDLLSRDAMGNSLVNTVDLNSESIKLTKQIVVPQAGLYEFDYSMVLDTVDDDCLKDGICLSCYYDLTLKLSSRCDTNLFYNLPICAQSTDINCKSGNLTAIGKFQPVGSNTISFACEVPSESTQSMSIKIDLQPGEYFLSKTLQINQAHKAAVIAEYLKPENNDCIKTFQELRDSIRETLPDGCEEPDCATCLVELGPLDAYIAQGGTVEDYESLVKDCNELCGDESPCKDAYELMLADMNPGGQYGQIDTEEGVFAPNTFPLSVYNESNSLYKNQIAVNALSYGPYKRPNSVTNTAGTGNWRHPVYFDETLGRLTIAHYMDDNGQPAKILIGTSTTSAANYQYQIIDPTQILHENNNQYVYPENLASVEDFSNLIVSNESWFKSLVYLHPEFEYLEGCLIFDQKFNGVEESTNIVDLSSNQFDSRMNDVETFSDAKNAKFLVPVDPNATPLTYDLAHILTSYSTYDNTLTPNTYDPFLLNNGAAYTFTVTPFTGSNYYGEFTTSLTNFYSTTIGGTVYTYDILQMSAAMTRCPDSFDPASPGNCINFGEQLVVTTATTEILNNEWNTFKSFYQSIKAKLVFKRENQWARNAYKTTGSVINPNNTPQNLTHAYMDGCNACIGNDNYDITQQQFYSPSSYGNGSPFIVDGACSYLSYQLYKSKQVRFIDPLILMANNDVDQEYQHFLETGQCPLAVDLENVLNQIQIAYPTDGVIHSSNRNINTIVNTSTYLKEAIYAASGVIPNSSPTPDNFTYTASLNGSELEADMKVNGVDAFSFKLKYTYSGTNFDWQQLVSFNGLFGHNALNVGDPNFTTYAKMPGALTATTDSTYLTCRGTITGLSLAGCSFATPCKPREITRNIVSVMNTALTQTNATTPSANVFNDVNTSLSLSYLNNNALLFQQFGVLNTFLGQTGVPDEFTWEHPAPGTGLPKYKISKGGASYVEMELISPLSFSTALFHNTGTTRTYLKNVRVISTDEFEVDLYNYEIADASLTFVSTLRFKTTTNGTTGPVPFVVGDCELEEPLACETPAHKNLDVLLETATGLVNDLYNGVASANANGTPNDPNLSGSIFYPAELLSLFSAGAEYCSTNEIGYYPMLDNQGFYGNEASTLPFAAPNDVPKNTFVTKSQCFGDHCGGPQYIFPDLFLANQSNVSDVSFGTAFYDVTKLNHLSNKYGVVAVPLTYKLTIDGVSATVNSNVYMLTCLPTEKCEVCPGTATTQNCNEAPYTNIMDVFSMAEVALLQYHTLNGSNSTVQSGTYTFLQNASSNFLSQLFDGLNTMATSGSQQGFNISHDNQNYNIDIEMRHYNNWKVTCEAVVRIAFKTMPNDGSDIVNSFGSRVNHVQFLGYNSSTQLIEVKAFFNDGTSLSGTTSFTCLPLVECGEPATDCSVAPYTNISDVTAIALHALNNFSVLDANYPTNSQFTLFQNASDAFLNQLTSAITHLTATNLDQVPYVLTSQNSPTGPHHEIIIRLDRYNDWEGKDCGIRLGLDGGDKFDRLDHVLSSSFNSQTNQIEIIGVFNSSGGQVNKTIYVTFGCLPLVDCNAAPVVVDCNVAPYTNITDVAEIATYAIQHFVDLQNAQSGGSTVYPLFATANQTFLNQLHPSNDPLLVASTTDPVRFHVTHAQNTFDEINIILDRYNNFKGLCSGINIRIDGGIGFADLTSIGAAVYNPTTDKIEIEGILNHPPEVIRRTIYVTFNCLELKECSDEPISVGCDGAPYTNIDNVKKIFQTVINDYGIYNAGSSHTFMQNVDPSFISEINGGLYGNGTQLTTTTQFGFDIIQTTQYNTVSVDLAHIESGCYVFNFSVPAPHSVANITNINTFTYNSASELIEANVTFSDNTSGTVKIKTSCLTIATCPIAHCPPVPPYEPPSVVGVTEVDPCGEMYDNLADEMAQQAFNDQIRIYNAYFNAKYLEKCLGTFETFKKIWPDKEYHHTLYYYDQAGNLVKTIPPEGVRMLQITDDVGPDVIHDIPNTDNNEYNGFDIAQQIKSDRYNNVKTLTTLHNMATVYKYNSLNQLTHQMMPDHDAMAMTEFTLPNGLDSRLHITSTNFHDEKNGYLTGYINVDLNSDATTDFTRGYLYKTTTAGSTWNRVNNIVSSDLKKVQMLDATTGYAVGYDGTVLKTSNGGSTWDWLDTYTSSTGAALKTFTVFNDLHFTSATEGIVVGNNGTLIYTNDGGITFTLSPAATGGLPVNSNSFLTSTVGNITTETTTNTYNNITGATYYNMPVTSTFTNRFFVSTTHYKVQHVTTITTTTASTTSATVIDTLEKYGEVYYSGQAGTDPILNYTTYTKVSSLTPNVITAATAFSDDEFYLGTDNGQLMKMLGLPAPAVTSEEGLVTLNKTEIKYLNRFGPDRLICLANDLVYQSLDKGKYWSRLSPIATNYKYYAADAIDDNTIFFVGKNGSRAVAMFRITGTAPNLVPGYGFSEQNTFQPGVDFRSVAAVDVSAAQNGSRYNLIAADHNRIVYLNSDATAFNSTWTKTEITTNGTYTLSDADTTIIKIQAIAETGNDYRIRGAFLSTTGKLFAFTAIKNNKVINYIQPVLETTGGNANNFISLELGLSGFVAFNNVPGSREFIQFDIQSLNILPANQSSVNYINTVVTQHPEEINIPPQVSYPVPSPKLVGATVVYTGTIPSSIASNIRYAHRTNSDQYIVADNTGNYATAPSPAGATTLTFTDRSNITLFVPLNDIKAKNNSGEIIAVGTSGEVYCKEGTAANATAWEQKVSPTAQILNSIAFSATTDEALVAGNNSTAYDLTLGAGNYTYAPINTGLSGNINDLVSVNTGTVQTVYFISSNARVSKIGNYGGTGAALSILSNTPINNQSYNGICSLPNGTVMVAGNSCNIFTVSGISSLAASSIYPPQLNDVSFLKNGSIGLVGGVKSFARHTNDGTVSWKVNAPIMTSANQLLNINGVQAEQADKGIAIDNTLSDVILYTGSTPSFISIPGNGTGTQNNLVDLTYDEAIKRYYFVTQQSVYKTTAPSAAGVMTALSSSDLLTPAQLTAGKKNTSIMLYQPDKVAVTSTLPSKNLMLLDMFGTVANPLSFNVASSTTLELQRAFVIDDYNIIVAGNNNNIYRVKKANNIPFFDNTVSAAPCSILDYTSTRMPLEDDITISATDVAAMQVTGIHFFDYSHGFIAGDLSSVSSSPVSLSAVETQYNSAGRYARLVNDETGFYSTRFWYDRLGRMVLSQNSKQKTKTKTNGTVTLTSAFSYTLYDELGRIEEVGEKFENPAGSPKFPSIFGAMVSNQYNAATIDDTKLTTWLSSTPASRYEVTQTYYDAPLLLNPNMLQDNLRKRVACTTYEDSYDGNIYTYEQASHYSYDIHGNVKTLWQENKKLAATYNQGANDYSLQAVKQIDYNYDLISGKVNYVTYQKGKIDEYSHVYRYDDDNRITKVYTIDNSNFMNVDDMSESFADKDASYEYYKHGPLLRSEIGDQTVQGTDYVYTLQGWIKGVNSVALNGENDPGKDGIPGAQLHDNVAKDAYGYALTYNNNDYTAIGEGTSPALLTPANLFYGGTAPTSDLYTNHSNLYNGNIAAMQTSIVKPVAVLNSSAADPIALPNAFAYKYDQLNRITTALAFDNYDSGANSWKSGTSTPDRYLNKFTYDANGNIITQLRNNADGVTIDDLKYNYNTLNRNNSSILANYRSGFDNTNGTNNRDLIQNRLYEVDDAIADAAVAPDDIEDQGTYNGPTCTNPVNGSNNYTYDAIGNLIGDASEQISNIEWTVYGKIKKIQRSSGSAKKNLVFDYDASGNRIAKHVYTNGSDVLEKTTYYTRDAQGNVMAVYDINFTDGQLGTYSLNERHLYGSSRLGMNKTRINLTGLTQANDLLLNGETYSRVLGNKQFEFSNHLGNVLSVISDKKIPIASTLDPTTVDHYLADGIRSTDYYPFGAPLPGRDFKKQKCTDVPLTQHIQNALVNSAFTGNNNPNQSFNTLDGWNRLSNRTDLHRVANQMKVERGNGQPNVMHSVGVTRSINVVAGRTYTLNFSFIPGTISSITAKATEAGSPLPIQSLTVNSLGNYSFNFIATTTGACTFELASGLVNIGQYFTLDDIAIYEDYDQVVTSTVTLINDQFTNPSTTWGTAAVDGWQAGANTHIRKTSNKFFIGEPTPNGQNNSIVVSAYKDFTTVPNATYNLSFTYEPGDKRNVIATITDLNNPAISYTVTTNNNNTASYSQSFTTTATASQYRITFSASSGNNYFMIDNVLLTQTTVVTTPHCVDDGDYRYGFNGKEKDDDTYGDGNEYDFGARIYDARLGRFLGIDPKAVISPDHSPYSYAKLNPLVYIDANGEYAVYIHYLITRMLLEQKVGLDKATARIIAHCVGVYADHPSGGIAFSNQVLARQYAPIYGINPDEAFFDNGYMWSSSFYKPTQESQNPNNRRNESDPNQQWYESNSHIWHGTRGTWEKDKVTIEARIYQTRSFAWEKLMAAANSSNLSEIKAGSDAAANLGQALHAFQDIEAHNGDVFPPNSTLNPDKGQHDVFNDMFGNTAKAQSNTIGALIVYQAQYDEFTLVDNVLKSYGSFTVNMNGMNWNDYRKTVDKFSNYKVVEDAIKQTITISKK